MLGLSSISNIIAIGLARILTGKLEIKNQRCLVSL